jgi:mycofactocin precursor
VSSIPEQLEKTSVEPESAADSDYDEKTSVEPESAADSDYDEKTPNQPSGEELVVEDLLVEDVSIDGMCGVY